MLAGNVVSLFSSAVISLLWGTMLPAHYDFGLLLSGVKSEGSYPALTEAKMASYGTIKVDLDEDNELGKDDVMDAQEREQLKSSCRYATGFGTVISLVLSVAWPIPMYLSGYVFSEDFFYYWVVLSLVWSVVASGVIIFMPIIESWADLADVCKNILSCKTNSSAKITEIEEHVDLDYHNDRENNTF